MRDRLGEYEDQFFSAVFYGSGLLFLGMVFVSMAIAGGILTAHHRGRNPSESGYLLWPRCNVPDQ